MVMILFAPAAASILATNLAPIATLGLSFLSCLAYPVIRKYCYNFFSRSSFCSIYHYHCFHHTIRTDGWLNNVYILTSNCFFVGRLNFSITKTSVTLRYLTLSLCELQLFLQTLYGHSPKIKLC